MSKSTVILGVLLFVVLGIAWLMPTPDESRIASLEAAAATAEPIVQEELEPMKESGPLEVAIDFEHEMDSRGRLRIVGETNLPNGTHLGYSLGRRGDKGQVKDGRFESTWFSTGGAGLSDGVYKARVTVPVGSSHPDSVQRRLGTGLEEMTGPLVERAFPDADYDFGKVASIEREIQVGGSTVAEVNNVRERIAAHAYWSEPGRHFAWSNLEYALTSMPGVLAITGRIKNVGPRDARYVNVKVSMRDARGREVGRSNVIKDDRFKSGESWWFDGLLTVRKPGGVELYMGPESITAFGFEY